MKSRIKQRANRKMKLEEERLDKCNNCGIKDLTAYNAVQQIRSNGKAGQTTTSWKHFQQMCCKVW